MSRFPIHLNLYKLLGLLLVPVVMSDDDNYSGGVGQGGGEDSAWMRMFRNARKNIG